MFVELHILQNFAPSNLNRDDTGAPKDCEFGGYRRARISSQCIKRAVRRESGFQEFLADRGGVRTRRLITHIAKLVQGAAPPSKAAVGVVADAFKEGGLERSTSTKTGEEHEKDTTRIILFVSTPAIQSIVGLFKSRWGELVKGNKEAKANACRQLGEALVHSAKAPDIAMFGRMVEVKNTTPFGKLQLNVDAACQVAHALSTNRISMEFDYFTAVDELPAEGEQGAGFLDSAGFNSACFYRYSNVDMEQLKNNLGGDQELALKTLEAFLRASVGAVPTGKQNSMAAHNPPSFVFAVVRESGLWNLSNAFLKPVHPSGDGDLVERSIAALDSYWGRLAAVYGGGGISGKWAFSLDGVEPTHLKGCLLQNANQLYESAKGAVRFRPPKGGQQ